MTGPVIQSAINFSEGRRADVIEAIADSIRRVPSAVLADCSADFDHNRMVATILGGPDAVLHAAMASARAAVERIDLRQHIGAHPRIGAVDVVPLVPIREISMAECVKVSITLAESLAKELEIPVYLYEESTPRGRESALPEIRRGGFEGLAGRDLDPDFGPQLAHSTAGATVVGAREPLIAHNVVLNAANVAPARAIAARIRAERDRVADLAGVRALGLWLASRSQCQVSMNLTRPAETSLAAVFDYVRAEAERAGCSVVESEVIGLTPRAALAGETPDRILWMGFKESQILEHWL